jgi:peptidoglycan/xylan/chitin deacetylase (PgdA/CDA1 family)
MTVANHPELVQEVVRRGHEAASHGFAHRRVFEQTREEFRADVERSVEVIDAATGRRPLAYRAPAFSINRRTPWAYEVLLEVGIRYDSSQYDSPRVPDRFGNIPKEPYKLGELWELPVTGGGAYWRVLPPRNLRDFAVLYFHPYEFGPRLTADLPPGTSPRRRLTAEKLTLWRNAGRQLVEMRLRRVAQSHRLVSYDQAYADIDRIYGTRTRALSPQGVLV